MALIVISGKARAGKDTLGEIMKQNFKENYFTMAYANELKRICGKAFELSKEQLWGDLKEVPDTRYPKKIKWFTAVTGTITDDMPEQEYWTPREILQHIGTESYRAVEDGFWVRQLFKYIDRNYLENVIITDGRFPDEINAVKDKGGIHIRIMREEEGAAQGQQHASEVSLDNFDDADYVIQNNGTIAELEVIAEKIIKEIENG